MPWCMDKGMRARLSSPHAARAALRCAVWRLQMPTFRATPLQPACDVWCDFPVSDRPNAVHQWVQAVAKEPRLLQGAWILLIGAHVRACVRGCPCSVCSSELSAAQHRGPSLPHARGMHGRRLLPRVACASGCSAAAAGRCAGWPSSVAASSMWHVDGCRAIYLPLGQGLLLLLCVRACRGGRACACIRHHACVHVTWPHLRTRACVPVCVCARCVQSATTCG